MVKARLLVKGNVQGVGYKTLVKLFARRLGVKGLVRNLEDGSVEVFTDGAKEAVDEFTKNITVKGNPENPLSLHVDEVNLYWEGEDKYKPAWRKYSGFEIDYGVRELRPVDEEMLESLEWSKLHFTGMSRIFSDELGGLKGEVKEMRTDIKGVHSEIKEMRTDMRSDMKDVHSEIKEMRTDVGGIHSEIYEMRVDMNKSFEEMAKRYDAISNELIRTRGELTRAVDSLVKLVTQLLKEKD